MRWEAMMARLRSHTIQQWFGDFVDALQETRLHKSPAVPPVTQPPALWPLRSVNAGGRYN
jgi:trehalose 6-phosphate synthase